MSGPRLAILWGRKAGSLPSFDRYSDALKSSGVIWDDRALDGWLTDPERMVPDNEMPFEGIKDDRVRADLLAFLKDATKPGAAPTAQAQMKGMGGMMGGGGSDPNLKNLEPNRRVNAVTHFRDTQRGTTPHQETSAPLGHNPPFKTGSRQAARRK